MRPMDKCHVCDSPVVKQWYDSSQMQHDSPWMIWDKICDALTAKQLFRYFDLRSSRKWTVQFNEVVRLSGSKRKIIANLAAKGIEACSERGMK